MPKSEAAERKVGQVRLERFVRPFLRMITNEDATIVFKRGDQELQLQTIDYDVENNQWTVNFEDNVDPHGG